MARDKRRATEDLLSAIQNEVVSGLRDSVSDSWEFATRPFKAAVRIIGSDGKPIPGAIMLMGAVDVPDTERIILAAEQATWESRGLTPDDVLEIIVLNRNFDKLPALCVRKPVRECAPQFGGAHGEKA